MSAILIDPAKRTTKPVKVTPPLTTKMALGCARDFDNRRFIYTVISPRARGLSVGIDMNPDRFCNFDCAYCEVDRHKPTTETGLDVAVMTRELAEVLETVQCDRLRERAVYRGVAEELLKLRQVAMSGDGEPTLCPNFAEAVEGVAHVRARARFPFFKLVLITNASGLDLPGVQVGLSLLNPRDEIWAKLDAGTQEYMNRVNKPACDLAKIMGNILLVARQRPVIIQSMFPALDGQQPSLPEIQAYSERLNELKAAGAQISLVQIYSATRPTPHSECSHLPLRELSNIARHVRAATGLRAEVF